MTNIYLGNPDGRQAGAITPSRFRPRYRALTDEEKAIHDAIKTAAASLEDLFKQARDLAVRPPQLTPIEAGADTAELVGEAISLSPFDGNPQVEYFAEGLKNLELAVMWTVKGLTA